MRFEDFVGLRYLMAKRDRNMLSVITLISIGGVAVGVMALIVVLSVMGGFEADFREKIIGSKAHVVISANEGYLDNYGELREIALSVPRVEGVNAFVEAEVMLNSPTNLQAAILRGIDYREITTTTRLAEYMEEGQLSFLEEPDALPTITFGGSRGVVVQGQDRMPPELVDRMAKAGAREAISNAAAKHGKWLAEGEAGMPLPTGEIEILDLPDAPRFEDLPDVDGDVPAPDAGTKDDTARDDAAKPGSGADLRAPLGGAHDALSDEDAALLAEIGEDHWVEDAPSRRPTPIAMGTFDREPTAELLPQKSRSRQMKAVPGLSAEDVGVRRVGTIILGRELKNNLTMYLGAELNVMSPSGDLGPTGGLPKSRPFKVVGSYYSGMFDFDAKMGYITIKDAQALLGIGDMISGIDVRCTDIEDSKRVRDELREKMAAFPNVRVDDWRTLNSSLFSAIELEKVAMFVILTSIILVASFNILCLLIMMVIEKAREIAIFKAMGTTDASVVRMFVVQGAVIGILGTVIGLALGLGLCAIISSVGLQMPGDAHYIRQLPVVIEPLTIALICLASLGISLLATVIPSRMAVKLNPVDGLRCE